MQKEEYLIKNACYSVTKYYLCKRNNKRSLLGRKQRSQVARSFPNRYQFSCTNKVTSLFSISCILRIILPCERASFTLQKSICYFQFMNLYYNTSNVLFLFITSEYFLLRIIRTTSLKQLLFKFPVTPVTPLYVTTH